MVDNQHILYLCNTYRSKLTWRWETWWEMAEADGPQAKDYIGYLFLSEMSAAVNIEMCPEQMKWKMTLIGLIYATTKTYPWIVEGLNTIPFAFCAQIMCSLTSIMETCPKCTLTSDQEEEDRFNSDDLVYMSKYMYHIIPLLFFYYLHLFNLSIPKAENPVLNRQLKILDLLYPDIIYSQTSPTLDGGMTQGQSFWIFSSHLFSD